MSNGMETHEQFVARLATMDAWQLLYLVFDNPEYLTDPRYRAFRQAIIDRHQQHAVHARLVDKERNEPPV
jgi:hypothetical protein